MRQVSIELGMPYTTYVSYEKDEREPNSETLILLANYFNCSIDYLIGRSEQVEMMTLPENTERPSIYNVEEQNLLNNYRILNRSGKNKLLDYSNDLVQSGNYIENEQKEKRA